MNKNVDLHMHTIVSDGEMTPDEILDCAKEIGLTEISITDHDAVGAYKNFDGDPVQKAKGMGISLITGVEMDSYFSGVEIHVLGYGIDIDHKEMNDYLLNVQTLRKQRLKEQIQQLNRALKEEFLKEEDIIIPARDTVMGPHLIHPLLDRGLFSGYREAKRWVAEHTKPSVTVPKPSSGEMIALLRRAGGRTFLAHPGYYTEEGGLDLDTMITELLPYGLDGLEVDYPYLGTSPKFQTKESERELIERLEEAAGKYDLAVSRGSDAHRLQQLRDFKDH
ncbi:MAG: PHP domain-containing protein [bacterium]|nr:PHP domain-containing protein [bacterium]